MPLIDAQSQNSTGEGCATVMNREQEIWGMALWVNKHHAADGHDFIAARIASLEADGEHDGANLWRQVENSYLQLRIGLIPIHGQPDPKPN